MKHLVGRLIHAGHSTLLKIAGSNIFKFTNRPIQAEPFSGEISKRQDKIGKKIESAPDQDQAKLEALALLESSLAGLWRTEHKRAGDVLILREPIRSGRR